MRTILFIYGTRPEAIKMAPLIREFRKYTDIFNIKICLTGQHRQMLDQINDFFEIQGDYDLNLMLPNQTLFDITSRCLMGLKEILDNLSPDLIFVQGDTTSVLAGSLAGFYKQIPVAHLEAGLRSGYKYSPFPEEGNRILTSHIAEYHFAPTMNAIDNLKRENITMNVYLVGNTVIDALHLGIKIIKSTNEKIYSDFFTFIDFSKKLILVTGHRRESFGSGFENICKALVYSAQHHKDVQFIYPVHLNPHVREPVNRMLTGINNIFLIEPLDYPYLIWLMEKAYFVLTDSGGIQEEAPALGKPVLVMREVTERQEGIDAGTAKLVGTQYNNLIMSIQELLENEAVYTSMANAANPYGDGSTSKQIVKIVSEVLR
jgi:UDP-N-acetylglucosamine 2-epimerase (non-hydrolysing)